MNLSDSVIMPREDFIELSTVAWNQPPTSVGERLATTVQTSTIFMGMAAAVTLGTWGWAKAIDWREQKKYERDISLADHNDDLKSK